VVAIVLKICRFRIYFVFAGSLPGSLSAQLDGITEEKRRQRKNDNVRQKMDSD
jgi:hypothetical protein